MRELTKMLPTDTGASARCPAPVLEGDECHVSIVNERPRPWKRPKPRARTSCRAYLLHVENVHRAVIISNMLQRVIVPWGSAPGAGNGCVIKTVEEDEDFIPAEVVFPKSTPGSILRGFRYRDALRQVDLSKRTGISVRHISEMETDKRAINGENARKLAKEFQTDPQMFLP